MSLYPFLRSPFTDLTGYLVNNQTLPNSMCAKFEMRLYDCLEAYGMDKGEIKCADLAADYRECLYRLKEDERTFKMRLERHRQYFSGERKQHYEAPPQINSW